jgi:hypothetical protein
VLHAVEDAQERPLGHGEDAPAEQAEDALQVPDDVNVVAPLPLVTQEA